jgi:hypothetical protein
MTVLRLRARKAGAVDRESPVHRTRHGNADLGVPLPTARKIADYLFRAR